MVELELRNVTKRFGDLLALNNLTFKIVTNKIVGVMGPNGSGKTVMVNVITKIPYSSDHGEIIFNGINLKKFKPFDIVKIGICRTFQNISVFPKLSVEQNIKASYTKIDESLLNEILDMFDLASKRSEIAANLNVYELKNLMIASCLATKPKLIILDEPLGGLSEYEAKITLTRINDINKRGIAVIIIEHRIGELFKYTDIEHVIVLYGGSLLAQGSPDEILNNKEVKVAYLGA